MRDRRKTGRGTPVGGSCCGRNRILARDRCGLVVLGLVTLWMYDGLGLVVMLYFRYFGGLNRVGVPSRPGNADDGSQHDHAADDFG